MTLACCWATLRAYCFDWFLINNKCYNIVGWIHRFRHQFLEDLRSDCSHFLWQCSKEWVYLWLWEIFHLPRSIHHFMKTSKATKNRDFKMSETHCFLLLQTFRSFDINKIIINIIIKHIINHQTNPHQQQQTLQGIRLKGVIVFIHFFFFFLFFSILKTFFLFIYLLWIVFFFLVLFKVK